MKLDRFGHLFSINLIKQKIFYSIIIECYQKKFLFFLFAISFILIAIFINEGYDDETFYGNDDEKREFKFFGNLIKNML